MGPPHDESGPRKTMQGLLMDEGSVTMWEVTGEKDRKSGKYKRVELCSFQCETAYGALFEDIAEAFLEEAERLGITRQVEVKYTTSEF